MGSRDHSVTCETCGLQRGGLNDYKCHCDIGDALNEGRLDLDRGVVGGRTIAVKCDPKYNKSRSAAEVFARPRPFPELKCATASTPEAAVAEHESRRMLHRVIEDVRLGLVLTLGVGADEAFARIAWKGGSCLVDASALCAGRWELLLATQEVAEDELPRGGDPPPTDVVCCATALAVRAWIQESIQRTLENLRIQERLQRAMEDLP
jgi:hypothetical protein